MTCQNLWKRNWKIFVITCEKANIIFILYYIIYLYLLYLFIIFIIYFQLRHLMSTIGHLPISCYSPPCTIRSNKANSVVTKHIRWERYVSQICVYIMVQYVQYTNIGYCSKLSVRIEYLSSLKIRLWKTLMCSSYMMKFHCNI